MVMMMERFLRIPAIQSMQVYWWQSTVKALILWTHLSLIQHAKRKWTDTYTVACPKIHHTVDFFMLKKLHIRLIFDHFLDEGIPILNTMYS